MPVITHPQKAPPGVSEANAFDVLDDEGMKCGSAIVVEYINQNLLPERPLNFYISISAMTERAFDMLMGAAIARSMELRRQNPRMKARIYTPCKPHDTQRLRGFMEFGFQNDDAMIRMRRILSDSDRMPNPPVGCSVSPVILEDDDDMNALVERLNAYSITARGIDWVRMLRQEQLFTVLGVWQEERLLGEMVLTAYGAEGRIEMMYTRPEYRRRGVALALIAYAGRVLLQNGIRSLNAEVWRRNTLAMSLMGKAGFESVSATVLYPGVDV